MTKALTVRRDHGRTDLTDAGIEAIRTLAREGRSYRGMAAALKVNHKTFADMRKRDPRIELAIDEGRGELEGEVTDLLLTQARKGQVVAAIFLAKARLGWREGDREHHAPPVAVNITLPKARSEDEYRAVIEATSSEEGDE